MSHRDYLAVLVAEEVAHRAETRIQRATRKASFPFLRTIEEFDFKLQTSIRLSLLGSYLGPELVTEGRSLILGGRSGRGKTHLAVSIAYRAIQNGYDARFTTAAQLIEELSTAARDGRLSEGLLPYVQPHVLVIDEVGCAPRGTKTPCRVRDPTRSRRSGSEKLRAGEAQACAPSREAALTT